MSLTFLAKSSAYSWKMSFDGQVLCQRMVLAPWALTTFGAATVAAAAVAPTVIRNLRRVAVLESGFLLMRRPLPGHIWGRADRCPVAHLLTCSGIVLFRRVGDTFTALARFHKPVTSPWGSLQGSIRPI